MGGRHSIALLVVVALSCSSATPKPSSRRALDDKDVVRYRLELRHNRVSPGDAFRCYGRCQSETSPKAYVECLGACPGFEITPGVSCAKYEVPPVAACLTVRKIPKHAEPTAGMIVVGTLGAFLLVIGASSLCAASSSQCGYAPIPFRPPPF